MTTIFMIVIIMTTIFMIVIIMTINIIHTLILIVYSKPASSNSVYSTIVL